MNVMRTEIIELVQLGQLPAEGKATADHLRAVEFLLPSITKPVSNKQHVRWLDYPAPTVASNLHGKFFTSLKAHPTGQ